jgi:hypothetical protein
MSDQGGHNGGEQEWAKGVKISTWPEPKRWARATVYIQRERVGVAAQCVASAVFDLSQVALVATLVVVVVAVVVMVVAVVVMVGFLTAASLE